VGKSAFGRLGIVFADIIAVESPTGATLALRRAATVSPPARAVVLICHGLAEHAARYRPFAEHLASRDYSVYAHDHRGHGATRADDAPRGRFAHRDGALRVVEDVMAIRTLAAAENPGVPILLFGHSMGGMIAASTAEAHPHAFDGLAIWNADLNPGMAGRLGRLLLIAERALKGSDVPSALAPALTFRPWAQSIPDHRTDFDWLSCDPSAVDAYVADPLCGWDGSVSLWLDVLQLACAAGSRAALGRLNRTMPIHLVGGGRDPATGKGQAMRWLARRLVSMGFLNVGLTIHAEMRHETLNEIGRQDAMQAFAAWADDVVSRQTGTP